MLKNMKKNNKRYIKNSKANPELIFRQKNISDAGNELEYHNCQTDMFSCFHWHILNAIIIYIYVQQMGKEQTEFCFIDKVVKI